MITTYKDYMPQIYAAYPEMDKKLLDKIILHGLRNFVHAHCYGAVVKVCNANHTNLLSTANMAFDPWHQYYRNRKQKFVSTKFKNKIDPKIFKGFYYFNVKEGEANKILGKMKLNKKYTMHDIFISQHLEEIQLLNKAYNIFRVELPNMGDRCVLKSLTLDPEKVSIVRKRNKDLYE